MNEETLAQVANFVAQVNLEINSGFYDVTKAIRELSPEPDKAFEIFKTIAPSLWDRYNDSPAPEFDEALKNAVRFSVLASAVFNFRTQHQDIVMGALGGQALEKPHKSVKG